MNLLVVRTSALGDIVHGLPVLGALRRHFPDARLGWVVEAPFAPIVRHHPAIDELIPVRMRAWRKKPLDRAIRDEVALARERLDSFDADVAIDLMGNHKSGFVARMSGAPRVVGATRPARREPSSAMWINDPAEIHALHAVDRTLDVLRPLGIDQPEVDFAADALLPPRLDGVDDDLPQPPYLLIQAGAGWGNKQYPMAWWGTVAEILHRRTGIDIHLPTAPGEETLAARIAAASRGTARVIEAHDFRRLARLLRGAALVLGGDTGPIHLAHALGAPVLMVMGPTDPLRNGPWHAPERSLHHRLPCSFCYKRLSEAKACLLALAPATVASKACELLRIDGEIDQHGVVRQHGVTRQHGDTTMSPQPPRDEDPA
ncbi:MAG: lipopolysaccharide heptosyltransferase I [Acidobacteriota bacterium]